MIEQVVLLPHTFDTKDPYTSYYSWKSQEKKQNTQPFSQLEILCPRQL